MYWIIYFYISRSSQGHVKVILIWPQKNSEATSPYKSYFISRKDEQLWMSSISGHAVIIFLFSWISKSSHIETQGVFCLSPPFPSSLYTTKGYISGYIYRIEGQTNQKKLPVMCTGHADNHEWIKKDYPITLLSIRSTD